jgi:hypothetical protein
MLYPLSYGGTSVHLGHVRRYLTPVLPDVTPDTFAEDKGTTDHLVAGFGKTRLVGDLVSDDFAGLRVDRRAAEQPPTRTGGQVGRVVVAITRGE